MISEKDKNRLKSFIIKEMYKKYDKDNSLLWDDYDLTLFALFDYDEYDVEIALKSLKADGFVELTYSDNDKISKATFTEKGVDYYKNHKNPIRKYFKNNHLAIIDLFLSTIAIIISIIALYYGLQ